MNRCKRAFRIYRFDGTEVERKERTRVYIEADKRSVERTIYTDGPNHYIIWNHKLTKVEFRESPIVRYRLKGEKICQ